VSIEQPRAQQGHVALVTGAGSGIGRAIARRLAAEGAGIIVADLDPATAEQVRGEIRDAGGSATACTADVSSSDDVARMFDAAASEWGRLDVLVNNAGIVVRGRAERITDQEWNRMVAVDLSSVFLCSRAALPLLRAAGAGRVVNIASVAGLVGAVSAPYTASKGGVIALTRQLAGEFADDGITVNCICPGFVATPLNATVRASGLEAILAARIPLRRWGTPEDVAGLVAFLVGPDAGYITGASIPIDGGLSSFLDLGEDYRSFDRASTSRPCAADRP
jgi:NAD(P)-dependent dehydrogenase (short-subunit alcohol dehydrogenase family)